METTQMFICRMDKEIVWSIHTVEHYTAPIMKELLLYAKNMDESPKLDVEQKSPDTKG